MYCTRIQLQLNCFIFDGFKWRQGSFKGELVDPFLWLKIILSLQLKTKNALRELSAEYIAHESKLCLNKLMSHTVYANATTMCCFLSMSSEILTYDIIAAAIESGKVVCIPKVVGPRPQDMILVHLPSFSDIMSFEKSRWGIPEPSDGYAASHPSPCGLHFDLVVVPAVAFDAKCRRLGHGKGYYGTQACFFKKILLYIDHNCLDCFLGAVSDTCTASGRRRGIFVGVALDEQIVENVPTSASDRYCIIFC